MIIVQIGVLWPIQEMTAFNRMVYRLNHILNHNVRTTSPTELVFLIKSRKAAGLSFFSLCLYKFTNVNADRHTF